MNKRIGLVGGGTGGHFYPLVAVAEELRQLDSSISLYYFGPTPYDEKALKDYQIEYISCPAGKLRRYFSIQNFLDLFRTFFGIFVAVWKLYLIYPDVLFSKGSYTSVPILLAARFLKIPVVIHESDAVPGRANQIAKKQARYIGIAYADAARFFPPEKTALIGIPLRDSIKNIPLDPFSVLGIPNDKPLIYVTGGSSGAERVNDLVLRSLTALLPQYRVFHQTGPTNLEEMRLTAQTLLQGTDLAKDYYLEGYLPAQTISALLSAASLVVTRAGSTTLFEIAYHGRPAVVIPIPEDISRDQRSNAYAYAKSGGAVVIEEHNLTPHLLVSEISSIVGNQARWQEMSAAAKGVFVDGAAAKIASTLIAISQEHER